MAVERIELYKMTISRQNVHCYAVVLLSHNL